MLRPKTQRFQSFVITRFKETIEFKKRRII
jgi:hypothetical protein